MLLLLKSYAAEDIQAIATYGKEDFNFEEFPEVFSRMSKLRLLIIDGQRIPNALNHVPNDLRYLPWSFCSLKCLPSSFQPKKLVQLDLRCSKFEYLWEEVMHSVKQKFTDLVVPKALLGHLTFQVFRDLRD
uniref:Uncharacterized protein n=1 Tax=Quercus lobata TaxID=97700 RepID=A0A7N2M9U4_QUELO